MKPLSVHKAIYAAQLLQPHYQLHIELTPHIVSTYSDMMTVPKLKSLCNLMDTAEDLPVIRAMLAGELSRTPVRLSAVTLLVHQHERIIKALRLQALLEELPAVAVAMDNGARVAERSQPSEPVSDLQAAITNAMHPRGRNAT